MKVRNYLYYSIVAFKTQAKKAHGGNRRMQSWENIYERIFLKKDKK